jgi:hypothetical protein
LTFKEAAQRFIAANKSGWRNAKHAAQWLATPETYAFPAFGSISVAAEDTPLVKRAIEPIWSSKTETARRVRGRVDTYWIGHAPAVSGPATTLRVGGACFSICFPNGLKR